MRLSRHHWLVIAGGLAFLLFLVAGLPARVALRWLVPASVQVSDLSGTLWRGSMATAVAGPVRLGPLSWELSPLPLLAGRIHAGIHGQIGTGQARGTIDLRGGGRFACSGCSYEGPAAGLRSLVPSLRGLSGQLRLDITRIEVRDRWPTHAIATLDWNGVQLRTAAAPALAGLPTINLKASIAADPVPADGRIEALLQDGGGPLQLAGQVAFSPPGNYQVNARIKARPDVPAQLASALATLGPPGPDGSIDIGMSGSL